MVVGVVVKEIVTYYSYVDANDHDTAVGYHPHHYHSNHSWRRTSRQRAEYQSNRYSVLTVTVSAARMIRS